MTEKSTLFHCSTASALARQVMTEKLRHVAGGAVCGFISAIRRATIFGCWQRIERDQVEDYAKRKGWSMAECERWLAPILNYNTHAANTTGGRREKTKHRRAGSPVLPQLNQAHCWILYLHSASFVGFLNLECSQNNPRPTKNKRGAHPPVHFSLQGKVTSCLPCWGEGNASTETQWNRVLVARHGKFFCEALCRRRHGDCNPIDRR